MMARLITIPLAPPSAWKKRAAMSSGRFCANTDPMPATTIRPRPANSTGLRPNLSDSGPMMSCERAMPTIYSDTVICAIEMLLSKVVARIGSAGTSI